MNRKKNFLYIIRSEADFERVVALSSYGIAKYNQKFIFCGDFSPFFEVGIQNKFQKYRLHKTGLFVRDFHSFSSVGRVLDRWSLKSTQTPNELFYGGASFRDVASFFCMLLLKLYLKKSRRRIIRRVLSKEKYDGVLTDATIEDPEYPVELFRSEARRMGIPSFVFTHGAAGGLHANLHEKYSSASYKGYYSFVCSQEDLASVSQSNNEFVLGDMRSSYDYQIELLGDREHELDFLSERKHKIGFIQGGVPDSYTSTNAWALMEKLIIELSNNLDVAIVVKKHPRERDRCDYRMIERFKNVKLVGSETDRSRLVRWADVVVCNDHCSAIFEPMIAGKKVIAFEGTHVPEYKDVHSPISRSSVFHASDTSLIDLNSLHACDPADPVINRVCWGDKGRENLMKLFFDCVELILEGKQKEAEIKYGRHKNLRTRSEISELGHGKVYSKS